MTPLVDLRFALESEHLLGRVMGGVSREAMRAVLLASQGEELTESEGEHYRKLTSRDASPTEPVSELHIFAGRRSGKSSGCAALAVYAAALCDYSDRLSPGERGVVLLIAENQKQAKILLNYIVGIFDSSPALSKLIVGRTQTSLSLNNRIDIEVRSADFRGLRGLTLICAIGDEICHWRSDYSSNPAEEIIIAVRPGLITTGGQLITIGSPYSKTGFGYNTWRKHFGPHGEDPQVLVANGATLDFNSTIPQREIDRAIKDDPAAAQSEWLGQWRQDVEAFISREVVEACVIPNRFELPKTPLAYYHAFCDPSGGSGDDMALAIAHRENNVVVLDVLRTIKPPFNPDEATYEFAQILKAYGCMSVLGDRYGGEWPSQRFSAHGINYVHSEKTKNEIYVQALPLLMGQRCELLDSQKLISQLSSLERKCSRGGRQSIDHPPSGHDDAANAACGALALAGGWADDFNLDEYVRAYGTDDIVRRWEAGER
ncbi:hypothetical protein [Methylocystis echinoides]|uniref:hypothetical protein n=1 Tax=Methylocystis echinoides TaxID=29468 RepID=UPI003426BDD7